MGVKDFRRSTSVAIAGQNAGLAAKLFQHSDCVSLVASPVTLDELHNAVRERKPEVVLIAATWGVEQDYCLAAIRELAGSCSKIRPALVLEARDSELILKALATGARGVIYSGQSGETICAAIQAIARGQIYAGPEELELLLASMAESPGRTDAA